MSAERSEAKQTKSEAMLSILSAARRIRGRVRRTPLVRSSWLSACANADVWLKLECQQETHAFKIRGALNAVLALLERRESTDAPIAVVSASAGNHGRALAQAAHAAGLPCTVFTPYDAPRAKLDAIRRFGAVLDATASDYDAAERLSRAHAERTGEVYISSYNDPFVVAGAGTIGLEILEDQPDIDTVVVPLGGGGLASGVATAVKTLSPAARTIGVELASNPAFAVSRAHGAITPIEVSRSIADGLTGNIEPGSITWPLVERYVDELGSVDEAQVAGAIFDLLAHEHLVVEGAGAVGVAAIADHSVDVRDRRVAVIVSGANIDMDQLASIIQRRPAG
jgi:threonine dehydratase